MAAAIRVSHAGGCYGGAMFRPDLPRMVALKNLAITAGVIVLSTLVYFVLPLGEFGAIGTWGFGALFSIGLATVCFLIAEQVRRYRSGLVRRSASIASVVASLYLAVLFFAAVYYSLAIQQPAAIASLRTKIDALYFALEITSTVGFGDMHPVSQLARAVVTTHMAFNIGFLGIAVSVLRGGPQQS
jgi:voltage-gated potassium channel